MQMFSFKKLTGSELLFNKIYEILTLLDYNDLRK